MRSLGSGVGVEEFFGLIHRQHQGRCGLLGGHIQQPRPGGLAGLLQPAMNLLHMLGVAGGLDLPQQLPAKPSPVPQPVDGLRQAELAGQHRPFGAHDVQRHELAVVAAQPRQQPGP